MPDMLNRLNLKLDGRHHSGIDDARNIAKIAQTLISKGMVFSNNMVHDSSQY
jgi:inhibitor of KinA sporulation pathway (predicted exonuclease)